MPLPWPRLLLLHILHLRVLSVRVVLHSLQSHDVFQLIFRFVACNLIFPCHDLLACRMHEEQPLFAQAIPVRANSKVDSILANVLPLTSLTNPELALLFGNDDLECCDVDDAGRGLANAISC